MNNNTGRHAYLLMVHNEWRILKILISLLDDERNDFYIHIDKKADLDEIPYDISTLSQKSDIILIPRMCVAWGGDTQIECVYNLMKAASVGHYRYYHFISGVDIPLMTVDRIFQYFEEHDGNSYFETHEPNMEELDRIRYFYLFQNKIGKGLDNSTIFFQKIRGWLIKLQKMIHVDRLKRAEMKLYKGEVWFSITDELLQYIISQNNSIKKVFSKTWCGDELCWGSIARKSNLRGQIVNDCLRYIDWENGDPYIFRKQDFDRIINSGKMFARKFSDSVDGEVVDMIRKWISAQNTEEEWKKTV